MNPTVQRLIAALAGTVAGLIVGWLGLELTPEDRERLNHVIETVVTGVVVGVTLIVKNRLDRRYNPANVADPKKSPRVLP